MIATDPIGIVGERGRRGARHAECLKSRVHVSAGGVTITSPPERAASAPGAVIVNFGPASSSTAARSGGDSRSLTPVGDRAELGRAAVREEIVGSRR